MKKIPVYVNPYDKVHFGPSTVIQQHGRALTCCSSGLVTSETWIRLRPLIQLAAGQNNGHTLIPKASGCYGAHQRRSPGSVTKHMNVPSAALVRSTVIAIQRETTCSRFSGRDAQVK